ncbi:MAG: DAK2 domain-containing protein [Clostridia bacterium]|nr:DAK2 domain-containing protein [Clostridia bacterium]
MINVLTDIDIRNIFAGAGHNLELNKSHIDSLNVFPVPDGDTGTNMNLTMSSALREMDGVQTASLADTCKAIAKGALKGARGNSGVILSQIFKGMTTVMGEGNSINTKTFASALKRGSDVAYDVVTHPKEGTILTVIRMVGEYAVKVANRQNDFLGFFKKILEKGEEVLAATPEMLPVLKKAGVVDAGGKGLLIILYGMYNTLAGIEMKPLEQEESAPEAPKQTAFELDVHNLEEINFAYCTEFFIINLNKTTTISDIDKLRDKLNQIGDCVIVVGDLQLVKVHVHTNNPDKALGYALKLGELDKPKIENMLEQSREFKNEIARAERKEQAMVAVCTGDGIEAIFKELGVDAIITGGQTMNPSVSDIINVVDGIGAKNVFVLPNNSNIILAAEQAKELTKANIVVIATKNIPQGISAAINFNSEATVEENARSMQKAAENVRAGQITHAVRDTEMDGLELHTGDIIGIYKKIIAKGSDPDEVAIEVATKMTGDDTAVISLYYGQDVPEEKAEALAAKLQEQYPYYDVMAYYGGQSHYYYYISVE